VRPSRVPIFRQIGCSDLYSVHSGMRWKRWKKREAGAISVLCSGELRFHVMILHNAMQISGPKPKLLCFADGRHAAYEIWPRLFSLSRMTFPPFHSARQWVSYLGWVGKTILAYISMDI